MFQRETDTVSRKQAMMGQEELDTRERYRLLVEYSKDIIGTLSSEGIWTYLNSEGETFFGLTDQKKGNGSSLLEFVSPPDRMILWNYLNEDSHNRFEMNVTGTGGKLRRAEFSLVPIVFQGKKQFHTTVRHSGLHVNKPDKELSLSGQMAAVIAHEIKNPLTAIKGFTQFIAEGKPDPYSQVILSELDRLEGIVDDLLLLAKPRCKKLEISNLVDIAQSVLMLLTPIAKENNIIFEERYESADVPVHCSPGKIKQVLINIVKNSIESMPVAGTILLEIKNEEGFAILSVKDEGTGISEDDLLKIGQPFYSTKENGTGLGLMVSKEIIKSHGGSMFIRSKENEGTKVTIRLPLTAKDASHPTG
ncbi:ATP-binding protein [Bacillus sp. FJAT-27445]|uniref:ATP-binding protein n=1 Tax=Bacillus sp. FJAT-27445 TaxID=1679166 RepID=UPI000744078F|nr:ATP-binding protein [Bacillus sp. FJAT-27445]